MIAIIDYDAGNIKSVEKALLSLGQEVTVTAKQDEILGADKIVLPGVGAFGDAMENLRKRQLDADPGSSGKGNSVSGDMPWTSGVV